MSLTLTPKLEYIEAQNFEFAITMSEAALIRVTSRSSRWPIMGFKRVYAILNPVDNSVSISLRATEGGPCRYHAKEGTEITCEKLMVAEDP